MAPDPPDGVPPADAARERVLAAHRGTVATVLDRADAAARSLSFPAGRAAVVDALDAALTDDDRAALVALLRDAADATGESLQAAPVPAPPYLALTGRGPLVRTTLETGRLVVLVEAFALADGGYRWTDPTPEDAVSVRFRRRP